MQCPDSIAVCPAKAQAETVFALVDDAGENLRLLEAEAIQNGKTKLDQAAFGKTKFSGDDKGTDHADVAGFTMDDLFAIAMPEAYFNIQRHAPALPGAVIHLSPRFNTNQGIVATTGGLIQFNSILAIIAI